MIDLDELANRAPQRRNHECGIAYALRVLDAPTAATLSRALANDNVTHVELTNALAELGVETSAFTVGVHRRGQCKCEPTT